MNILPINEIFSEKFFIHYGIKEECLNVSGNSVTIAKRYNNLGRLVEDFELKLGASFPEFQHVKCYSN